MSAEITEKFHVKNLDCASCAAKIERGLKKFEGVDDVTVNFANLMLHVRANDIQRIIKEVRRIEPNVVLIPESKLTTSSETTAQQSDFNLKREIWVLSAASILFGLQLVFEDWFHQKPFAGAEYIIVIMAYLLAGWNVLLGALRTIRKGAFFDENVLMVIATGFICPYR